MQYRQLGNSGLKVSVLTMGTMTFGGKGMFAKVGDVSLEEVRRLIDICRRRRRQSHRHRQHLFRRPIGGADRRGDADAKSRHADRDQGALSDGRGAQRPRLLALASHPRMRGEPQAPAHRRDRPLPAASVGRPDPARGDDGGARRARALRQGALRRLLELFRLAHDEGDGGRPPRASRPVRLRADPLHPAGARRRIRAPADRRRPEARRARLEPARRRPALRQASPQQGRARGHAPVLRLDRAAGARRERALDDRRRTRRDRRGAWRLGGADRARLASRPADGDLADHRRADGSAVPRQSRLRQGEADRRGARPARHGEPAAADLSLLAPVQDGEATASTTPTSSCTGRS